MDLEQTFLDELVDAIDNDRLTLPTLPEVALKIREAVEDPEVSCGSLAGVIGQDAALAAKVIQVANSPLIRGTVAVDNLQLAITRMGLTFVRNLATGLAMEQMFQATNDEIDKRLRDSWEHSLQVASISHVMSKHYTKLQPDQATLAGLVHEIGTLPILTLAEENPEILEQTEVLDRIIERLRGRVGHAILSAWDFPEELKLVPLHCTNFDRDESETADYIDVVQVAKLQSYPENANPYANIDTNNIASFRNLGLSTDIEIQDIDTIAEEVKEAKQAFS